MRKSVSIILFMAACSNGAAQDQVASIAVPNHTPPAALVAVVPVVPLEPVIPVREPRRSVRKSAEENEWLTKVCVSEGGFSFSEAQKLLQTLENMREMRSDKSLLKTLFSQTSGVTRRKPFKDLRQVWISYLPMTGDDVPQGWIECTGKDPVTKRSIPTGCSGTWKSTVRGWTSFREQVRQLYYSGIVPETVPGKPIQWGGEMDYHHGVARKFCPLNVGHRMANTYWGDPRDPANAGACLPIDQEKVAKSKVMAAELASGRAKRRPLLDQLLQNSLIPQQKQEANDDNTRVN